MFDAAGSFERDISDGLGAIERQVLGDWDAGHAIDDIAQRLGKSPRRVRDIVDLYDDTPEPDPRAGLAAVNAAFVARVNRLRERNLMIEVSEIEGMLKDRVESLVHDLLPNARKDGHELCVGGLSGEAGQSLRIHIGNGSKRGWWKDFASSEGGDCLKLIAAVQFAGDIKRAVQWAKSWLKLDDQDPARLEQHRLEVRAKGEQRAQAADAEKARKLRSAKARWQEAAPLSAGDPVARYLATRGIDLAALGRAPGALRYHEALQYGYQGPRVPAMVAMVTALDGTHIATHRTWIKPDGSGKADAELIGFDGKTGEVNDPKKVMGSPLGGHIPLWKGVHGCPLRDIPAGTDVYVSEGIEDGLTAACADPSIRVICMIALGYLSQMELPPQMGALIILKQNDAPGSDAAKALTRAIAAHRALGRRVLMVQPPAGVKDLNDLARGG